MECEIEQTTWSSGQSLSRDNPSRRQRARGLAVGLRLGGSRSCVSVLFEHVVGYKQKTV